MPTGMLSLGKTTTITQNTSYALPTKLCFVQTSVAVETSLDGTTWAALTGANTTGVNCGALFIRCTTGDAIVCCKGYY